MLLVFSHTALPALAGQPTMIALRDITLQYPMADTTLTVLDALNLQVAVGERVAIVGPSGSGKTSLLLVLTGLEAPSAGEVVIAEQALGPMSRDQRADLRRDHIGIVFQSFHLIPSLSASENVALPLEIAGVAGARERARAMLERVGLGTRHRHYPSQLSGGEQQRVAIARALVHRPGLLVADEPTGNLDGQTGSKIIDLLFELNRESGTTLLLVTHDTALAERCDRRLHMHEGRLHNGPDHQGSAE